MQSDLFYSLVLEFSNKISTSQSKKLLSVCRTAKDIFTQKKEKLYKLPNANKTKLDEILKIDDVIYRKCQEEIDFIEKNNIKVFPIYSQEYPVNLKCCPDAPNLIFQKGNINFVNERIISIVGTRNMTNYGRGFCKELVSTLKPFSPVIISGLAFGVDIEIHKQSIKNGIQNIGVLAHGLDKIYPAAHKNIAIEMMNNGGLFTEHSSKTIPDKYNFPKRNRIIAGLSHATIVVESNEKGGSLITAEIANSYNREVLALPGRSTDIYSKGCNNLIQNLKASMITSAGDIAEILSWNQPKKNIVQQELFVQLSTEEDLVYNILKKNEKMQIDEIAIAIKQPTYKVAQLLLQLELKNTIISLPGKYFKLK